MKKKTWSALALLCVLAAALLLVPAAAGAFGDVTGDPKSVPDTAEAVAVEEAAAPVAEDAAPAEENAVPVEEDAAPVEESAAPAEDNATPAEEDAAPAEAEIEEEPPALEPEIEEAAPEEEAFAPGITVHQVRAQPGDSMVAVPVTIRENPGILGMALSVLYDASALELTGASNGEAVRQVLTLTKPGRYVPQCRFLWDGQEILPEEVADGELITLYFRVLDSAPEGPSPILLFCNQGDVVDNDLSAVSIDLHPGAVIVQR